MHTMRKASKCKGMLILGGTIAIAALLACALGFRLVPALVIKDSKERTVVKLPLFDGRFVHHFIHSVHKRPVDEYFEVHEKTLELEKVKYDTYGVGMPSDGGEAFTIEKGRFVVTMHRSFSTIPIRVSTVPDHGIVIEGTLFPFTQWVAPESALTLSAGRMLIFQYGRISPK